MPPVDSPSWQAVVHAFAQARTALPRPVVETASTKVVHELVAANADMVGVLPADVGHDLEKRGGVTAIRFPGTSPSSRKTAE